MTTVDWAPPEPTLHVFQMTNGPDSVVAKNPDDAWAVWEEHCGENRADYDEFEEWDQIPDDRQLVIRLNDLRVDDLPDHEQKWIPKTSALMASAFARDWAEHSGRAFLCSEEW